LAQNKSGFIVYRPSKTKQTRNKAHIMPNPLVAARNIFADTHPENRKTVNTRDWGMVFAGNHGPALVLLPGTLGRADIFWNQINALSGKARILSLSYPETGSIQDWCDDIKTLMSLHKMDSATILGSSLGGYVAQYFAAVYPALTDNLIAANTLHSADILANLPPYSTDIDNLPAHDLMQGFLGGLHQWAGDEPDRADLVALLVNEVTDRIPLPELRNRIKALKHGPTLPDVPLAKSQIFTVESDDDRLIPAPVRDAVRNRLTPSESLRFEHGSHFPYLTHPADYSAMIAKILNI